MSIQVNKLTNANVYLNGQSFIGRAEEVTLPDVKAKMADHKGLGMIGVLELPSGIDKLEAKFKWSSLYTEVMKAAGNPHKAVSIQVRSSLETWDAQGRSVEQPVVVHLMGTFKNLPLGGFKHQDNAEFETLMAVTAAKLIVNGEEIFEIDVLQNIHKVGGEDLLANFRTNIGG